MKKYTILIATMVTAAFISCEKNEENEIVSGTYSGIYIRGRDTANVTLVFDNANKFTGSTDKSFPLICSGTVTQDNSELNFTNDCRATQNIDYLNGLFNYTSQNNKLTISKTLSGETATYNLSK